MADVRYAVTVDAAGAVKVIETLDAAFGSLSGTIPTTSRAVGDLGRASEGLWQQFAAGSLAVVGVSSAFSTLKSELVGAIKDAADYEKSFRGLSASFDISGRTMPGMVDNLKKYANQMRDLGLADEASVAKVESLVMSLATLDEKGIKVATRGAIGLSSVMGVDLQSAAEMATRGMEGNYFSIGRLIPAVRMATDEDSKRAAMMKAFEGLYARAIADTDTYAGQVKKLDIAWDDAKRRLVESSGALEVLRGAATEVADVLDRLSGEHQRKAIQGTEDFVEAEKEASEILWKVGDATSHASSWAYDLGEKYHWTAQQVLENVRAGTEGIKEQKAAEAAVKEHNAAVGALGRGYTETGQTLAQLIAEWNKGLPALGDMTSAIIKDAKNIAELNPFMDILTENESECSKELAESNREFEKQARVMGEARAAARGYGQGLVQSVLDPFKGMTRAGVVEYLQNVQKELDAVNEKTPVNKFLQLESEIGKATSALSIMSAHGLRSLENWGTAVGMLGADLQLLSDSMRGHSHTVGLMLKAVSMAQAYINTEEAVTKALAQGGFIFGIPMAAVVQALGWAQIALMAATPIPLAKGAVFTKPTLLPATTGTTYQVAEAGAAEVVAPEPMLRRIVREESGRGGATLTMNFNAPVIQTTGLSSSEIDRASTLIFASMQQEARRLGFRLR